jgi:hypothetical protein
MIVDMLIYQGIRSDKDDLDFRMDRLELTCLYMV